MTSGEGLDIVKNKEVKALIMSCSSDQLEARLEAARSAQRLANLEIHLIRMEQRSRRRDERRANAIDLLEKSL